MQLRNSQKVVKGFQEVPLALVQRENSDPMWMPPQLVVWALPQALHLQLLSVTPRIPSDDRDGTDQRKRQLNHPYLDPAACNRFSKRRAEETLQTLQAAIAQ